MADEHNDNVTDDSDLGVCSHVLGLIDYFQENGLSLWGKEGKQGDALRVYCHECKLQYTLDPAFNAGDVADTLLNELDGDDEQVDSFNSPLR